MANPISPSYNISGGSTQGPINYTGLGNTTTTIDGRVFNTNPTSPNKGQVLGATTNIGGGGNNTMVPGGWYGGRQWTGSGWADTGSNGNNGNTNTGPSIDQQISDAYAPSLSALDKYSSDLNAASEAEKTNTLNRISQTGATITQQGNELTTDAQKRQQENQDAFMSAYADAIRNYNALKQQGGARFGGGNSASRAMGEIANQEFLRQQGANTKEQTKVSGQFADTFNKIGLFVSNKKQDLENYKNEALSSITANLNQKINEINMRRGDIEINKTKDKLGALETARSQAFAVQTQGQQFIQTLAANSIAKMEEVAGRAFTAPEIAAIIQQFDVTLGGGNKNTQQNVSAYKAVMPQYNPNVNKKDEFV